MSNRTKYCKKCGEPLYIKKKYISYDRNTGEPKEWKMYRCYKASWWKWGGTDHDGIGFNYVIDD